jgi:hypothetical protein
MKFKYLKTAVVSFALSLSCLTNVANAVLIDNDSYTTDTVTGLDWLDWTATVNMSESDALAANVGYILATDSELRNLWDTAFNTSFSSNSSLTRVDCSTHCWQTQEGIDFRALFGNTEGGNNTGVTLKDYGLYALGSRIYAGEANADKMLGLASSRFGIGLVKNTTVVPEPATLAIFVLSLMGLASRRFKKHA